MTDRDLCAALESAGRAAPESGGLAPFQGQRDDFYRTAADEIASRSESRPMDCLPGQALDTAAVRASQRSPVAEREEDVSAFQIRPRSTVAPEFSLDGQSGSGFFVTRDGVVATNYHVIKNCESVRVHYRGSERLAEVIAREPANDMALLRTVGPFPNRIEPAPLYAGPIRLGEPVVVAGYPLGTYLGEGAKVSTGNVSGITGVANDVTYLQMSAPIQPGNSGGPLLDQGGNAIGMVAARLNAAKVALATGTVPRDVNFALRSLLLTTFLDVNEIQYKLGARTSALDTADIAENASYFTVRVNCGA